MTELQAVNTILMYINELPATQQMLDSQTPIPIIEKTRLVLDEEYRATNSITGTAHNDISLFDDLLQDYMVKNASERLYSRTFGFEDKGLEVIAYEKSQNLGNVIKYFIELHLGNEVTYGYSYNLAMQIAKQEKDIAGVANTIQRFKTKLDSIEQPSFISLTSEFEDYKLMVIKIEMDSQVSQAERDKLFISYVLSTLDNIAITDNFKNYIANKIKALQITRFREAEDLALSIMDNINAIVVPTGVDESQYRLALLQLSDGSELGKVEKDLLLKSIVYENISNIISENQYDYLKDQVVRLIDYSTLNSITNSIGLVKSRIVSVYNQFTNEFPMLVGNNTVIEYIAEDLKEDSEVTIINKMSKLNSIAKYIYTKLVENNMASSEVERVLLSIPIDKQNIKAITDISNNITTARLNIENAKKTVLSYGWSVNTKTISLYPNTDGYIVIPKNFLSVNPNSTTITVNDWKLFDETNYTYKFENSVDVEVIEDLPYDDLSWYLKEYIDKKSLYDTYRGISGYKNELTFEKREVEEARITAFRNDANNERSNILESDFVTTLTER